MKTVLLTTSGLGSRLGDLTKYTNKSLVRVGRKPSISYIIGSYPADTRFIVTLGHFGGQVREYLGIAHPNSKFEFVEVDNFDGPGSSLGYSILCSKDKLNCPFIFHACDTIMTQPIDFGDKNCLVGAKSIDSNKYRSFDVSGSKVVQLKDKGEIHRDFDYAGLCQIIDHEAFFNGLQEAYDTSKASHLGDCDGIIAMLAAGIEFSFRETQGWLDIGNSESLLHARHKIYDPFKILDKADESIFFVDNKVIKFFHDEKICSNRVKRALTLEDLIPEIIDAGKNFYSYKYIEGDTLSSVVDEEKFFELLRWSNDNLWNDDLGGSPAALYDFYFQKTRARVEKFVATGFGTDQEAVINGVLVPPVSELLTMIDEDRICGTGLTKFHGDFILDNIIYNDGKFRLIDWRQDFAGRIDIGDAYYDLAKLNHSLVINHELVNQGMFTITGGNDKIKCDILTKHSFAAYREILNKFIADNKYDPYKVKILTAIIWINMAPLHTYPLNKFLFYFGRYNLYREIKNAS